VSGGARAVSPKRAIPRPAGRCGQAPGPTATWPRSAVISKTSGETAQSHPGDQLEDPSAAVSTLPQTDRQRQTRPSRRGGDRTRTDGLHVGYDPGGSPASLELACLHDEGPQGSLSVRRGAAPAWCHPRSREEAATAPRAETEAGTRRTRVKWYPTHGYQQDQPSSLTGSASSSRQGYHTGNHMKPI
jgi:hypothetical protein